MGFRLCFIGFGVSGLAERAVLDLEFRVLVASRVYDFRFRA